jgi:integrase
MYKRNKTWISDFFIDGRRYVRVWKGLNKTQAKQEETDLKVSIQRGEHIEKPKDGKPGKPSRNIHFEVFAEDFYLRMCRTTKMPKTAKRAETSIKQLNEHFKGIPLKNIHPLMVEEFKKARRDEGVSPATINKDLDTLKSLFKYAVSWGYLRSDPISSRVKRFRADNTKEWILSDEEEERLLKCCEERGQRKKYLRDLTVFALYSGMRQGEIFNLKKFEVNLKDRYILVSKTKTHHSRKVPINDTLYSVLKRRIKEDPRTEYVFSNEDGHKLRWLTSAFWEAIKSAGLTRKETQEGKTKEVRFRFHDLRHTFGSRLGMNGVELKSIMEIMGHRTERMAMRYQHPTPVHKLDAVKTLDRRVKSAPQKVVKLA